MKYEYIIIGLLLLLLVLGTANTCNDGRTALQLEQNEKAMKSLSDSITKVQTQVRAEYMELVRKQIIDSMNNVKKSNVKKKHVEKRDSIVTLSGDPLDSLIRSNIGSGQ